MKNLLTRVGHFCAPIALYRHEEDPEHFAFRPFLLFVLANTVLFMTLVYVVCYFFFPDHLWVEFTWGWQMLVCFVIMHLMMSLFEYLFHRYLLHGVVWKWLAPLRSKHQEHHGLTPVVILDGVDSDQPNVVFDYDITTPEQIRSSSFPAWALITFWGVFSLIICPTQLLLPELPMLTSGYLAVVFSFTLYEVIHAIEHKDYEKHWKRWVEGRRLINRIMRKIYGFHVVHHQPKNKLNMAIGGFFGLPIWDWAFRTYHVPGQLPLPGGIIPVNHPKVPVPRQPIVWFDTLAAKREQLYFESNKRAALIRNWITKNQSMAFEEMLNSLRSNYQASMSPRLLKRHCRFLQKKGQLSAKIVV